MDGGLLPVAYLVLNSALLRLQAAQHCQTAALQLPRSHLHCGAASGCRISRHAETHLLQQADAWLGLWG